jgi:tRNA A-37 threonylcarbamoyl transferase component Bud32
MRVTAEPEDPKNHLYLRTEAGMLPLNERFSIEEIASRLRPGRQVTVSPLAGVLNEVFLLTAGKEQFVAKKFTDWHGFKWFTLNLVSFGSKLFAVSGKTRMENEYGMNRFLAKNGIKVPQVVYASLKERTLVERYVPGVPLDKFVIKVVGQSLLSRDEYRLSQDLGDTLGRIHEVGVSMGDSKPENFVAEDGEIFAIDLEQAGRRGDYAWDIAELLFYSGHYSSTQTATRGLSEFVEAFIQGYLKRGRGKELKRAAGVRYAKVFSLWTPAPVILEITQKLRASNATQ